MINVKKIADEIAEKCGVEEVYVNLDFSAWAQFECGEMAKLAVKIDGGELYSRKCLPVQDEMSTVAHGIADEWLATKDEREKDELEAARALLAKHEGGDQ